MLLEAHRTGTESTFRRAAERPVGAAEREAAGITGKGPPKGRTLEICGNESQAERPRLHGPGGE